MIAALVQGTLVADPTEHPADPPRRGAMVRLLLRTPTGGNGSALVSAVAFQPDLIARCKLLQRGEQIALAGTLKPSSYQKNGVTEQGLDLTITGLLSLYDVRARRKAAASPSTQAIAEADAWMPAFE